MIKKILIHLLFATFTLFSFPAWANAQNECAYESSGVNIQKLKKSKEIHGFEQLKKNEQYTGNLKGIGGFHLQLFSCSHYGATFTLLLGPEENQKVIKKALVVIPRLFFSGEDATQLAKALIAVPLSALNIQQHLSEVSQSLNLSDINVQVFNVDGMTVLVFGFYGG